MKRTLAHGDTLYTEDVFWVLLDYEVTRSQRYPTALSLLQMETTPTTTDPNLLRAATSVFNSALNSQLRSADICTGNEHSYRILLPTTDEHGGRAVCERLLSIFRNRLESKEGHSIIFSINIGLASHAGGPTLSKEELLDQSKQALQMAQRAGRNTFAVFSEL